VHHFLAIGRCAAVRKSLGLALPIGIACVGRTLVAVIALPIRRAASGLVGVETLTKKTRVLGAGVVVIAVCVHCAAILSALADTLPKETRVRRTWIGIITVRIHAATVGFCFMAALIVGACVGGAHVPIVTIGIC
jgi:hypothetical protein